MHLGRPHVIGCWEVDGALVDPGPESSLETVLEAIGDEQPRALLLTHIHLDHAAATGALVRRWPELEVYVHERGAPHLIDPSKLLASAERLYGDQLEHLWGEILPVPEANVRVLSGGETVLGMRVAYTPGHASHHVCYLHEDSGTAFVGDVAACRIPPSRLIMPPTPPPDIDVEVWEESLDTGRGLVAAAPRPHPLRRDRGRRSRLPRAASRAPARRGRAGAARWPRTPTSATCSAASARSCRPKASARRRRGAAAGRPHRLPVAPASTATGASAPSAKRPDQPAWISPTTRSCCSEPGPAEAGRPTTRNATKRLVERIDAGGFASDKPSSALHFVCGALTAYDSAEGKSPFAGLDVERVFAAVELLRNDVRSRSVPSLLRGIPPWTPGTRRTGPSCLMTPTSAKHSRPPPVAAGEPNCRTTSSILG